MIGVQMSLGEAAEFFKVNPRTLQTWVPHMLDDAVDGGNGKGKHRVFRFGAIMQVAIAREAMELGVTAGRALAIGFQFAYSNAQRDICTGFRRVAAYPLLGDAGDTYLIALNERVAVYQESTAKLGLSDLFSLIRRQGIDVARPGGVVIINASQVFNRVMTDLGQDPANAVRSRYAAFDDMMRAAESED